jgi:hypothetical protein
MSQEIPPDYADYEGLLQLARNAGEMTAKRWIPRLCEALRKEDSNLSNDDIRDRIERDCGDIWRKETIRNSIPEEYKNPDKVAAGKKGRQKQLEEPIPAGSAHKS